MSIEQRLAALEEKHRSLKRCTFALAAVLAGVLLMGQSVQGERLELSGGAWRIALGPDEAGTPRLSLTDASGRKRVRLDAGGLTYDPGPVDPAHLARARADCKRYYDAARVWQMVRKQRPKTLRDLAAPLQEGDTNDFAVVGKDPWDADYLLEPVGGAGFRIRSLGPDGVKDTPDDITYPD